MKTIEIKGLPFYMDEERNNLSLKYCYDTPKKSRDDIVSTNRNELVKQLKDRGIAHISGKKNLTNMTEDELRELIEWFDSRKFKK